MTIHVTLPMRIDKRQKMRENEIETMSLNCNNEWKKNRMRVREKKVSGCKWCVLHKSQFNFFFFFKFNLPFDLTFD